MKKLKVLSDFHHSGLLNSLITLFEGRLGGELYRPIGRAWHTAGYWKVYDHPETIAQYLDIGGATPDDSQPLNNVVETSENRIYKCHDISSGKTNKAIGLEAFLQMDFDVVIASIPQHIEPFRLLCNRHQNKPILIYQIGNQWNISREQEEMIDGILSSATLFQKPNKPYVIYHQEFSLETFKPDFNISPGKLIRSFVNTFNIADIFRFDWHLFESIERQMPEWKFEALGGGCRDGMAHGEEEVARMMRESRFIWHTKFAGDGYGHIIHNTGAVGKPTIVRKAYYVGKMAESLMRDGVTCIAIDGLSESEIINKIEYYSEPDRYKLMCENVYNNFIEQVDFNREAEQIETMLSDILNKHGKSYSRLSDSSS